MSDATLIWILLALIVVLGIESICLFIALNNWRRRHLVLENRHLRLETEATRMFGIHQNLLADHAGHLRRLGANTQPVPTTDQWMAALATPTTQP